MYIRYETIIRTVLKFLKMILIRQNFCKVELSTLYQQNKTFLKNSILNPIFLSPFNPQAFLSSFPFFPRNKNVESFRALSIQPPGNALKNCAHKWYKKKSACLVFVQKNILPADQFISAYGFLDELFLFSTWSSLIIMLLTISSPGHSNFSSSTTEFPGPLFPNVLQRKKGTF